MSYLNRKLLAGLLARRLVALRMEDVDRGAAVAFAPVQRAVGLGIQLSARRGELRAGGDAA